MQLLSQEAPLFSFLFFPMTHGASSRLNVAEGFYRSGWLPGKPALPCQGAASDPLWFISSCHSGSPTHISPAFNLGLAKNNGILSPKARGCPVLDNSNNNSAKNSLCQEISCFTSTHNPLSAENNIAEYLLSIQCQCKTAENVCHCLWLARSQRTPHVLR